MSTENNDTFEFHEVWKNPETGRNKKHVYLMNGKQMTGVTTVLQVLAKPALIQWAADMACAYVKEHGNIEDNPAGIFYCVTEEQLAEARVAHAKKKESAGDRGTEVHALVEKYIKDCIENNEGIARTYLIDDPMLQEFVTWAVMHDVKFLESEKKVYNKELFIAGTADFTCEIGGKRYVGDLKTGSGIYPEHFYQTAAYRMMLEGMGENPYDGSVVVQINKYTNQLAEEYRYDYETDRAAFLAALTIYRSNATYQQ